MKNEDLKNLEEVYKSINNKEKELISEDANETFGAALVYLVAFGIPVVLDYFSRKYPELKEKFNQIKDDLKNVEIKTEIKNLLKRQPKPQAQPQIPAEQDKLASMLSGGVRKPQPDLRSRL